MEEWKEYKLNDVATLSTGFPFDGHKYAKEGIRVVRGDNVTIGSLRWDTDKDKRWNEPFNRASEYSLRADDIVIGMDGSRVGKNRAQIKQEDLPLYIAQRVACIRHNDLSLQTFLYYQIFSQDFENYIKAVQTGTSIPHVSLKQIGDFPIMLPSLKVQQKIADILKTLDKKIEVNRKLNDNFAFSLLILTCFILWILKLRNDNLEQQVQALFKSWFVDFEPFKDGEFVESEMGMIPKGWCVGMFLENIEVMPGGTPSTSKEEYWNDGKIPFFSPKDVSGVYCFDTEKHITKLGLNNCSSHLYPKDTLFITARGTVGKLALAGVDMAMNQSNYALVAKKTVGKYYLYLLTQTLVAVLLKKANGAVFSAITTKDFKEPSIMPPTSVIVDFENRVTPIFAKIHKTSIESRRLAQLRDTLLPRLMSGELKVEAGF